MIGGYIYGHTDCWQGLMKYATQIGSGAMTYVTSVIKIGSGIQKLIVEGYTCRHTHSKVIS
jgi:hypothetical protein